MPARDLLARCSFPPPGTPVTCAVSGGADSLALLVLAVEAGCEVTAVHVDHGLRPGSGGEADVVAEVAAARWGAALPSRSRSRSAPGPNLEARARRARYAALPADVLTGHTADDQAETVLLNLLRGAGLDGLAGFDPARRPLRRLRRRETHKLCADLGIQPVHDPSNDDPRFRRNRVRHELLPLLDAIAERDVAPCSRARPTRLAGRRRAARRSCSLALDPTDARSLAAAPAAARGPGGAPLAARRRRSSTRPTPPPSPASWPSPGARPSRARSAAVARSAAADSAWSCHERVRCKGGVGGEAPAPVRQPRPRARWWSTPPTLQARVAELGAEITEGLRRPRRRC